LCNAKRPIGALKADLIERVCCRKVSIGTELNEIIEIQIAKCAHVKNQKKNPSLRGSEEKMVKAEPSKDKCKPEHA
jgi:hypothetical protein